MSERAVMIDRLEEIRVETQNFNRQTMCWKNKKVYGQHLSEMNFNDLSNVGLVRTFESIINWYYRQG